MMSMYCSSPSLLITFGLKSILLDIIMAAPSQMMMAHTFNPSTQEAETGRFCKFKAGLVYRVSSRAAMATQRDPYLNKNQNQTNKKWLHQFAF